MKQIKNPVGVRLQEVNDMSTLINFSNVQEDIILSNFNIIHFLLEPGKESTIDQHKSKEYWFIIKGEGILKINKNEKHDVKKGELYFFDSMTMHQISNHSQNESLEILSIWW